MSKLLHKLRNVGAISPPSWLPNNVGFLTVMGSTAYGVSTDDSDLDIYGFCIPPREIVFPHLAGVIPGFGDQGQRFEQWQEHHIKNPDGKDQTYDFAIFGIVKYFQLCMDNNPNMLNSLFVPDSCIMEISEVGHHTRARRREFLHRGAWPKFKGYAYGQMGKIRNKVASANPARAKDIERFGYDLKYAMHTVRLLNEIEQILMEGDLDLLRNREQLKSIRRGEWTFKQLEEYFVSKEAALELQFAKAVLPPKPDQAALRELLLECLEIHYGSVSNFLNVAASESKLLGDLRRLVNRYS